MATNFFLAHKDKEKSNIDVIVRFKSERYKRSSGESVEIDYWNDGYCREVKEYPRGKAINIKLKNIAKACDTVCDKYIAINMIPNKVDFWKEVDIQLNGGRVVSKITFVQYLEAYIEKMRSKYALNTIKQYNTTLGKLKEYEEDRNKHIGFVDIDLCFYQDFESWMYSKNHSSNYFGTIIKHIKVVFREAKEVDYLHNSDAVEYRNFKTLQETSDTIYLNEDELMRIHKLEFNEKNISGIYPDIARKPQNLRNKIKCYEQVRAKFLIGCYTALRVSDFNRLEPINIGDDFIKIRTKKVGNKVVIPIHWMVKEIMEKGFDIESKITDQKINEHIKEICALAGINEDVEITKNVAGRKVTQTFKKYQLVTNHTARRSGATNMYKAGIPTLSIMKITGHTTEKSFLKYIKITAEENAEMLAQHHFFNKPVK